MKQADALEERIDAFVAEWQAKQQEAQAEAPQDEP
jgi:hypothetical protein